MVINWIREQVEAGLIQLQQIREEKNTSNVLTKVITGTPFRAQAGDLLAADLVNSTSE